MMAFRQECSAGRLVGFIWVVLKPKSPIHIAKAMTDSQNSSNSATSQIPDLDDDVSDMPILSQTTISPNTSPSKSRRGDFSNSDRFLPPTMKKLSGTIIPRQPRVKTKTRSYETDRPSHTAYYSWPENSRGQVVLEEKDYKRMNELLLVLDFANLDLAREGTARWTNEVLAGASMATNSWGASVTGTKHVENKGEVGTAGVATLNMNLVKKKRKAGAAPEVEENGSAVTEPAAPQPNILGASMIRKKVKI
jgi:regulator of Ty1 transposition protein 109